jgi:exodeoxyribonuclease VII small subunit
MAPMASEPRIDAVGFEAAVRLLEQTVSDLETGDLGLDRSLARYQEGVQLLAHCYGLLENAERVVGLLRGIDADGNPQTVPFDLPAPIERQAADVGEPRQGQAGPCADDGAPF